MFKSSQPYAETDKIKMRIKLLLILAILLLGTNILGLSNANAQIDSNTAVNSSINNSFNNSINNPTNNAVTNQRLNKNIKPSATQNAVTSSGVEQTTGNAPPALNTGTTSAPSAQTNADMNQNDQ